MRVLRVYALVHGAVRAFLVARKVRVQVAVVTSFEVVGGTESPVITGFASVAIGGVSAVAKFAPVVVPAHDLVVSGGEASVAV